MAGVIRVNADEIDALSRVKRVHVFDEKHSRISAEELDGIHDGTKFLIKKEEHSLPPFSEGNLQTTPGVSRVNTDGMAALSRVEGNHIPDEKHSGSSTGEVGRVHDGTGFSPQERDLFSFMSLENRFEPILRVSQVDTDEIVTTSHVEGHRILDEKHSRTYKEQLDGIHDDDGFSTEEGFPSPSSSDSNLETVAGIARVDTDEMAVLSHVKKDATLNEKDAPTSDEELDGIHDGIELPTEEEKTSLRRANFLQQPLPEGSHTGAGLIDSQSGASGLGLQMTTALITFYKFWLYATTFLGSYIADTYLGRYNTVCLAVSITLIGHVLLVISAVPGVIEVKGAVGCFTVALIVMGLGMGMFKANISPLIAEQYSYTKMFIRTTKIFGQSTRRSGSNFFPHLHDERFMMISFYFYLFNSFGVIIGQVAMTCAEKYVGFWLAFTLPTVVFLVCPLILWLGRHQYIRSPPAGPVLSTAFRLWKLAAKGRWSANPVDTYKRLKADDFWENVKPSKLDREGKKPAWMTFDDQWVDEVNRGFKTCAVFAWYPVFWLSYNQISNSLPSQGATMSSHGFPEDILLNIEILMLITFIPIFDLALYPFLFRIGIKWTSLKKITAGFYTGSAAMIWAAIIQVYIYKTNPCGRLASGCESPSTLNVWTQSGSYVLIASSEILASITGLEYAFTKAPANMKSLVISVYLFTSAIAAALGEALDDLANDPLLVWNYGSMGVFTAITGTLFWLNVRKLDSKEDQLNGIQAGSFNVAARYQAASMEVNN
ncbi:hypothetical protein V5O48_009850 [Marasmius crinis-equi]|uniref:Uncharacterized protein n=1 Tax=Marasmius crinis-equi TaxID=585013 RepID=A0ABR3FA07_9AGAR